MMMTVHLEAFLLSVARVRCRVNTSESLLNSHLNRPSCVTVETHLPSVCQCGESTAPVCVTETTTLDTTKATVTYVTSMTFVCINPTPVRYVLVI